jgi:phospholipid-binding lipoprotein MlaA
MAKFFGFRKNITQNLQTKMLSILFAIVIFPFLNGCATTQGSAPNDPWESWNKSAQAFNDGVDSYVMKPVAKGYDWVMPTFAHQAVTNFFSNLDDIDVIANDTLQGKFSQSGEDGARFLVNSTIGLGGLIDIGTKIGLIKHNEDFDQTFGYWGIPSGPYLVLPFFGPSSPRGVVGLLSDATMNPFSYAGIYFGASSTTTYAVSGGLGVLKVIDSRANNLGVEKVVTEAAIDRYEFFKNAYLSRRNYLIHDGNVPEEDDLYLDEKNNSGFDPIVPY